MKKTLLILLVAASLVAKAQSGDVVGGTTEIRWNASPQSDCVTNYTVYSVVGTTLVKRLTITGTNTPLSTLGINNGPQAFCVTASNVNGESVPSTNVMAIYVGNKPNQVTGVTLVKP